jgi:hypothetical protein
MMYFVYATEAQADAAEQIVMRVLSYVLEGNHGYQRDVNQMALGKRVSDGATVTEARTTGWARPRQTSAGTWAFRSPETETIWDEDFTRPPEDFALGDGLPGSAANDAAAIAAANAERPGSINPVGFNVRVNLTMPTRCWVMASLAKKGLVPTKVEDPEFPAQPEP